MDDDTDRPQDRSPDVMAFGAPSTPRRRWRWRRLAAAALVGGLAVGVAGVAIAATDTPTPSPSSPSESQSLEPRHGKMFGFGGRHMFGMFGALHGEFVVPNADGGYQTLAMQRGVVTKVSKTEITVRSEDDVSKAYAVTGDTSVNGGRDGIDSVEVDDQVDVIASVANGKYTALQVVDVNDARRPFERFGPRRLSPEGSTTNPATPS
jgi:hypothetical protein